jgi:hypothetical protein
VVTGAPKPQSKGLALPESGQSTPEPLWLTSAEFLRRIEQEN